MVIVVCLFVIVVCWLFCFCYGHCCLIFCHCCLFVVLLLLWSLFFFLGGLVAVQVGRYLELVDRHFFNSASCSSMGTQGLAGLSRIVTDEQVALSNSGALTVFSSHVVDNLTAGGCQTLGPTQCHLASRKHAAWHSCLRPPAARGAHAVQLSFNKTNTPQSAGRFKRTSQSAGCITNITT